MRFGSLTKKIVVGLGILLVAGEVVVRISGIIDVPLYAVDPEMGYIPEPNQSGCFLRNRCWVFNDRSMGTAAQWDPSLHPNILLIGNSVVMGGNSYDQPEKLGPRLQQKLGMSYSVWPIATGGWSNLNEAAYLERNPAVSAHAGYFVWEYMSGGLSELSGWRGDYVFPRTRPKWALWYVIRRYLLPRILPFNMDELPPHGTASREHLVRFELTLAALSKATGRKHTGILLVYPTLSELIIARQGKEWLPEAPTLHGLCDKYGLQIVDVAKNPKWNDTLYRDGVHPTAAGNMVLASILDAEIKTSFEDEPLQ